MKGFVIFFLIFDIIFQISNKISKSFATYECCHSCLQYILVFLKMSFDMVIPKMIKLHFKNETSLQSNLKNLALVFRYKISYIQAIYLCIQIFRYLYVLQG